MKDHRLVRFTRRNVVSFPIAHFEAQLKEFGHVPHEIGPTDGVSRALASNRYARRVQYLTQIFVFRIVDAIADVPGQTVKRSYQSSPKPPIVEMGSPSTGFRL